MTPEKFDISNDTITRLVAKSDQVIAQCKSCVEDVGLAEILDLLGETTLLLLSALVAGSSRECTRHVACATELVRMISERLELQREQAGAA